MKKTLFITLIFALAVFGLFAARTRSYTQLLVNDVDGGLLPGVENTSATTDEDYAVSCYVTARPTEIISTATYSATYIRIWRFGNGTSMPYATTFFLQFGMFATDWTAGEVIHFDITHIPTGDTGSWELTIPDNNTSAIGYRQTVNPIPQVVAPPWAAAATYTVNMSTVPAGYITPTTLGPVEDVTTIYGTYTPTAVSATGYWTPASLTIDANTVWVADGYNFRFDQEFVWTELDYNNYHLTLNVVDTYFNGAYDINGYAVQAGTPTPIDALMVPALDPNPIDVDYTIAAAPDGYYWMPSVTQNPEFEMLQTKASKGVADYGDDLTWTLMQVNNYYRVIVQVWNGIDYNGVYDFTGPLNGSTPYVSTPITTYADYFGTYTMESPAPAGWHWEFTTYSGLDAVGDFAQDPNNPYLWTAYVTFNLIEEGPVPVELSSFTATLTGQFYVQLSWTTQTETQMVGYRVYRSTTADQSTIELIDNPLVPATNTSTTQNYTVVDKDVLIGQTYYYWLEAVDYNNSNFHGPVSVTVTGNVPPVLPEVTEMKNAYPNPFKANSSTNIEVSLKAGDTGTLSIYNVQGQLVKIVSLTEGTHMVNWNGRDTRGNACGSGIYFYKLSTQSMNQTKKMVIVK